MSKYNQKWCFVSIIYLIFVYFNFINELDSNDSLAELPCYLLIELSNWIMALAICYILFPILYKYIGNWRFIKFINKIIDKVFNFFQKAYFEVSNENKSNVMTAINKESIKEEDKKMDIDSTISSNIKSDKIKNRRTWIWKILKCIIIICIIWGILILIYEVPLLRIPAATIAGFIGVKAFNRKKEN